MNFEAEKRKPVAIGKDGDLVTLDDVLNRSRRLAGSKFAAAGAASLLNGLTKEAQAKPDMLDKLVVARLLAEPDRQIRLMGGREFSAKEAANEVQKKTDVGDYFKRLELRTIEIVEQSLAKGEIS